MFTPARSGLRRGAPTRRPTSRRFRSNTRGWRGRRPGGRREPIHVPSAEVEAARDLVRAREDARLDRMPARHRLSKFCLRHGRRLPGLSWGVARRKWLSEQRFPFPAQQQSFDTYVHALDLVDARICALERVIAETAEHEPWRELVARLRCLRGVDTLTALGIV